MAIYVPNATDFTEPLESQTVESAALEFRTLKARVNALDAAVAADDLTDLRVPETSIAVLPAIASRAGKVLGFDAGGDPAMVDVAGATDPSLRSDLAASSGASLVGYLPAVTGAAPTTVQSKLRESVSVKDFGAVGDGVTDDYLAIKTAWDYCLVNSINLYFPLGVYSSGTHNMPFKNPEYPATTLLDCKNITIYGDGPATVLQTDSVTGADVLNLYSVKNLHIRNLGVTAYLSEFLNSGSNGCSIVGGFDNITIDGLWLNNLPYVDKGSYLDGGKGLTVQPGVAPTECGTLKATRIYVKGCVYASDVTVDYNSFLLKKAAISFDVIAEDCFVAFNFATGISITLPDAGATDGIKANITAINCQYDARIFRVHTLQLNMTVNTTKTAAARRLNPLGVTWQATDTVVTALYCAYAKNSVIKVIGNKGECDHGVMIGGAVSGAGLNGATENCDLFLDIGNTATISSFNLINFGGNRILTSRLQISLRTASTLPAELYTSTYKNNVIYNSIERLVSPIIETSLKFAYTDGISSYSSLVRNVAGVFAKQTLGSSAALAVGGYLSNTDTILFAVRNDGNLIMSAPQNATSVVTVKGVRAVYTSEGVLYGYIPIYSNFA